jgi:hypothetical protein
MAPSIESIKGELQMFKNGLNAFGVTLAGLFAVYLVAVAFWGPNGLRLPASNEVDPYTGLLIAPAAAASGVECTGQKS